MNLPRTSLFLLLLSLLTACSPSRAGLGRLFGSLQQAAKNNNEKQLRRLTIAYVVGKPLLNLQEGIVQGILSRHEKGDFAYSDSALRRLRREGLSRFEPITEAEWEQMNLDFRFGSDPVLYPLQARDVLRFEQAPAVVVVFRFGGRLRLFYWRDLPVLDNNN